MNRTQSVISAVIILIVFIANQIGWAVSESEVTEVVMAVATLVAVIIGIYRNHNFTDEAQEAEKVLKILKDPMIDDIGKADDDVL